MLSYISGIPVSRYPFAEPECAMVLAVVVGFTSFTTMCRNGQPKGLRSNRVLTGVSVT